MNIKDIKNLKKFIRNYILDSSVHQEHIPPTVGITFRDYQSQIADNDFTNWMDDVYFEKTEINYKPDGEPKEKKHIKLTRIIYEKSDNLQYCWLKAFQEEYVFLGQDDDLQIEKFRFNEYNEIERIRQHQLKLCFTKQHYPDFEYILKARVRDGFKYIYLILNDHFVIFKLSGNIKKIGRLHHYLLFELEKTSLTGQEIEISIRYQPRTLGTKGIFYIDDNKLFLTSLCGFFPNNIKGPLQVKIQHETENTVVFKGKDINRKKRKQPCSELMDLEFNVESTEDICLYISQAKRVKGQNLQIYSQRDGVEIDLPMYSRIMQFYKNYHQTGYGRERLKIVEAPELLIDGLSFPGVIFLSSRLNQQHEIDKITIAAHEIAHQWWGYHVRFKGNLKNWLKESFPEYLKNIYIKEIYGKEFFKYQMREAAAFYLALKRCQKDIPISRAVESENIHDGLIYGKGVYVIHMLAKMIGPEILRDVIRKFMSKMEGHSGKVQDFGNFHKIIESETGKSFEWFFLQWLFEPGCPCLDINYSIDHNHANLNITQQEPIYKFPLEISLFHRGEKKTDKIVWISRQNESIKINTAEEIEKIIIDPENNLLQISGYFLSAAHVFIGLNQNDKQRKESELLQAVQLDPFNLKALYFLMEFYALHKKYKKLRELYEYTSTIDDPINYFKPKIETLFKN